MYITLTALIYNNLVIGAKGERPDFVAQHASYIKDLQKRFVLVGRKTYEAMGSAPIGKRTFVLSRNHEYQAEGVTTVLDLPAFIAMAAEAGEKQVVVFGGAQTFHAAMPWADTMCLTWVKRDREGEMKFPSFPPHWHAPVWDEQVLDEDGVLLQSLKYHRWSGEPYPCETPEEQAMFKTMNAIRARFNLRLITKALPHEPASIVDPEADGSV